MSYVYAFAGGKGGIGKSFLATNIGRLLAGTGKTVLLADLDLGSANLHSFLGVPHPARGLNDYLNNTIRDPAEAAVSCSAPGLWLLGAGDCDLEIANLPYARKQKIINAFKKLSYDYVLLDIGAGTSFNTLDFILAADEAVLVFTDEPTAIENGVRLIKSLYFRKARQVLKKTDLAPLMEKALRHDNRESFFTTIERLTEIDDREDGELRRVLAGMKFRILVNQNRIRNRPPVVNTLRRLCQRHFLSGFDVLGTIDYDTRVHESIVRQRIFTDRFPGHQITTDLTATVNRLLFFSALPEDAFRRTFNEKDHYEVLDMSPRSAVEDIRRAYTDIKSLYTGDASVADAFFTKPEQEALLKRIDTAFTVLNDPGEKADYDGWLAEQLPSASASAPETVDGTPPGKEENEWTDQPAVRLRPKKNDELKDRIRRHIDSQAAAELAEALKYREIITGKDLKAYRQACKIDVETIFEVTRVTTEMIRNIEEDHFSALPPQVYLKSFLKNYADILGLSARAVISGYLRHLRDDTPNPGKSPASGRWHRLNGRRPDQT